MRLPGQLKDTTLGDLLGALHRERADGTLELIDGLGQRHRIDLRAGNVEHVETSRGGPLLGELLHLSALPECADQRRLGEELLAAGIVDQTQLTQALHEQNRARLEQLFQLREASIRFHAPRPQNTDPTNPAPLHQREFLEGRARRRGGETNARQAESGALRVLGLPKDATPEDIRRAFRELAQTHHPDRHPDADCARRLELFQRFADISRAYHSLSG